MSDEEDYEQYEVVNGEPLEELFASLKGKWTKEEE